MASAPAGVKPRGTAERSGTTPATSMRTPNAVRTDGTRPRPASSIGHRSGRQGPACGAPGSHRPSGAIAAGRTITPSSRTGFSSTTSVCAPRPSPVSSARACSATPGAMAPCQVTRTTLSTGEVPSSTERALLSPAICDWAATLVPNIAASAIPSAGSHHRAGRRRARAPASISGASNPRTLWGDRTPSLSHGTGTRYWRAVLSHGRTPATGRESCR